MMKKRIVSFHKAVLAVLALVVLVPWAHGYAQTAQIAQASASRPEETEWTWEVRPSSPDPKLPNVLLLGDSITRNYYPEVQRQLTGVANIYLMASSISVGDPRLQSQIAEFGVMEAVPFRVVHFNNGMHGWTYSEGEYKQAFPAFLAAIHALTPKAELVWATTTPVKVEAAPGPTNARVVARNVIAKSFVEPAAILVDDQYGLMVQHPDTYQDNVHFNDSGSQIQGKQAAEIIRKLLQQR
jgi:lysophospholipase L1-like esterase